MKELLYQEFIEGKIKGAERGGRSRKQLLDDLRIEVKVLGI